MITKPIFKLNGVDYSELIKETSYYLTYEAREGKNSGVMKDGSRVFDLLAYKAVISFETEGNEGTLYEQLIREILSKAYVDVSYYDLKEGAEKTSQFIPAQTTSRVAYFKDGMAGWYDATKLQFTER